MTYTPTFAIYSRSLYLYGILLLCLTLAVTIYSIRATHQLSPVQVDTAWQETASSAEKTNLLALKIQDGDTLVSILHDANINNDDIQNVLDALRTSYDPKKLHIGQKITLTFDLPADSSQRDADKSLPLQSLKLKISPEKSVIAQRRANNSFTVSEVVTPLVKQIIRKHAVINNSLMATVGDMEIPANIMVDIIKAYSYDVDFQRDIQPGDQFDIVFENLYTADGEFAREGDVIFASLILDNQRFNIYKHTTANGATDYFNEKGYSVRKELLRTPLNIIRISSGFGVRKHPVLGYSKMHKGIDFAASAGTPIFAAGNGVVEEMGRKGGYGNYVRIRHNADYSTAYAHASRFTKGLRRGDKVSQGDIIAYVGSTGRSTGPHLHYEVIVDNKQINPLSVKVSPGLKLAGAELDRFLKYKHTLEVLLAQNPNQTELAYDNNSGLKKTN